ncbi:MAG TPA: tetratricopeptide repeat protein [Pseudolabrys sp.]|nr:tetratricopeptide repeat protein [Pseudolabrys sp.]
MAALPLGPMQRRAARSARAWLSALLLAILVGVAAGGARADGPVRGDVSVYTDRGYARLVFRMDEEVEATAQVSGAILVIQFKKPVDVSVDRLNASAPDYISAARRDPDGSAIRIALARKIKLSTIPAAERYYVDLLPEDWKGLQPGLPQEVIDDLARRTRVAEKELRKQRGTDKVKEPPVIRVRVARQPTFVRYVFDMPGSANVVPTQKDGKLTLSFDQQIKWDMADAVASLPPTVKSIDNDMDYDSATVNFVFNGTPEVHSFREDRSIAVDVATGDEAVRTPVEQAVLQAAPGAAPAIAPPETVPAHDAAASPAPPAEANAKPTPPVAQAPAPVSPARPPAQAAHAPPPEKPAAPIAAPVPPAMAKPPQPAPAAAAPAVMPAPAPAAPVHAAAATPAPSLSDANVPVAVGLHQSGDLLRLEFPFLMPTPAAAFLRADTLWLVFDSVAPIDVGALSTGQAKGIRRAAFERAPDGAAVVRITLARPRIVSLDSDGPSWLVTIADTVTTPSRPLSLARTVLPKNRAAIAIPFEQAGQVHELRDPTIGDRLLVITAPAPVRGFLKAQQFVELRVLASAQGVAVQPAADDVTAQFDARTITIARPNGLSLSSGTTGKTEGGGFRNLTFDTQVWGFDRAAPFIARQSELMALAAAAPENKRKEARFNLARFYIARDMAAEAKAVLEVALSDERGADDVTGMVLKAVADLMLDRPDRALKTLLAPQIGAQQDAPVWRAVAYGRLGQWTEARAGFKNLDDAIGALPVELQRMAMQEALRAAIEVGDYAGAARLLNEFDTVGVPDDLKAALDVLSGRLDEALGRNDDALAKYRSAAASPDRRAAAQGRLREISMMLKHGKMPRKEVIAALETLTTTWRGDETETEGLKILAHLYTEDGRYRAAFHTMRTALLAHPNSDWTRKIQDEAAATFDSLFLAGKGDALPPIEALGLFYDYRELTPIGRRGDEMIRRLADRLVAVDLLDQAAELLQHQVDHRLQGAARAQVATRLAVIYLMNHKPARALATLRATRMSDLANELREPRLMLEARALSETGRHDVALELIADIKGREARRLRSDILWAASRWRPAAEQIEELYGERWRDFRPLNDGERDDILRAAIGYSLSDETISLMRLRERYGALFADGPDRRAFDVVSAPIGVDNAEFKDVAKRVVGIDTLSAFLKDLRQRYPGAGSVALTASAQDATQPKPAAPKSEPAAGADKAAMNVPPQAGPSDALLPTKPPVGVPLRPDLSPTGSISRAPRARPR